MHYCESDGFVTLRVEAKPPSGQKTRVEEIQQIRP